MRKSLLLILGLTVANFYSFSQSTADAVAKQLTDCECNEILMISGADEKKYTSTWLENVSYEEGFIVFKKGANKHMWNADKVVFIEKGAGYIRVFLEQSK